MPTLHGQRARFKEGLREVAPGVHAWLQPNGSWGESNAALIVGDGESLLVDTLWTPALTQRMLDAMGALTARAPIRTLVNTHADGDHTWGNQLLAGTDIVSTPAAREEMAALTPDAIARLRRLAQGMGVAGSFVLPRFGRRTLRATSEYIGGMFAPFDFSGVQVTPPGRTVSGTTTLEVGGRRVELIEVGPAHTHGDLIVHVPDAKAVIAADVMFVGVTPVMWAGPVGGWLAALDRIAALAPDVVVPGHGPACGLEEVAVLRDYWSWLDAAARRRLAAGRSPEEATRDIVESDEYARKPWSGWDSPERTVIGIHTIKRHLDGDAKPVGIPDRVRIFMQVGRLAA